MMSDIGFEGTSRRGRQLRSWIAVAALALAMPSCQPTASAPERVGKASQAETPDSFGVGTGRDGAFTATSANQVVNSYAPITALNPAATQVSIGAVQGAAAGFAAGDLVLVWRTTGLAGFTSGSQSAIALTGDVGAYEFGRVESVASGVITLTNPLSSSRYATGSQIVRVPEYTTATIAATFSLAPYAWDGTSGGIVVFFATGAVTTTGTGSIVADGAGFRGGGLENSGGPGGATAFDGWVAAGGGAHKGEGLVPSAFGVANPASPGGEAASTYGRGNYANGAGGGDAWNAGGGGGGNGGAGGIGGRTWKGDGSGRAVGGLPGVALTYSTANYLALGGGGGAGEENNNDGSAGGNGGGVILVRAGSLTVAGTLSADGASAANDANAPGDGLGGGGAGGTIVLEVNAMLTCVAATATGGNGGTGAVDPDGPGGGGGGGVVVMTAASGVCVATATGGLNGTTTNGPPANWGAAPGNPGTPAVTLNAGFGGVVCTPSILASNGCGGCVSNGDCPPTAPLCDATKNTCGTCLSTNVAACTGTSPTCNTASPNDVCAACTGNNGAVTAQPCPTSTSPACVMTGPSQGTCAQCTDATFCSGSTPVCGPTFACVACNGDDGTTATLACPSSAAPYCTGAGSCGKCATDSDCTQASHAGPFCNTTTGACGVTCSTDAECGAGNWCDNLNGAGLCQPQVSNGNSVPAGACVDGGAVRACVSGVCDSDGDCGYANGDGSCTATTAAAVCRSGICAASGANAGKCVACVASGACSGTTPVCDSSSNRCEACNGDHGTSLTEPCPTTAAPFCNATTGACGTCTNNASCAGSVHAGPLCNATSGACGVVCAVDGDCPAGDWCDDVSGAGICQARTANGIAVPGGSCGTSDAIGSRACASGVCDPKVNDCGYANGDGPCTTNGQCQSGACVGGTCSAATGDGGIGDGGINDGGVNDGSPRDSGGAETGAPDAGTTDAATEIGGNEGGTVAPPGEAGAPTSEDASLASSPQDNGSLAGGGISCAMRQGPTGGAKWDLVALAVGFAAVRRRRRR